MPNWVPKDEVSLRILETAQSLFTEHGVENVSMYQVAQTTGVGQGTLYRRYPNKSKLCQSLMESKVDRFMDEVERELQERRAEPVVARMTTILTRMLELAGQDLEWIKALVHSPRLDEARANCFGIPLFQFVRDRIEQLLAEAQSSGELNRLDLQFASTVIASTFTPELIVHLSEKGYSVKEIAERYCETFIEPIFSR